MILPLSFVYQKQRIFRLGLIRFFSQRRKDAKAKFEKCSYLAFVGFADFFAFFFSTYSKPILELRRST